MDESALDGALAVFRALASDIGSTRTHDEGLDALTRRCVALVPGADAAGVTVIDGEDFRTVGATDGLALKVDAIQYELRSGPCVEAALEERAFRANDLRDDPRWPEFGKRAAEETGVHSMLAYRLFLEDESDLAAALNVYATAPQAFDDVAQLAGLAASAYGAALIIARRHRAQAANLERALDSNREIGAAVGVLMAQHRITREQAFDLLRMASQSTHRKLVDIARGVVDTGSLDM